MLVLPIIKIKNDGFIKRIETDFPLKAGDSLRRRNSKESRRQWAGILCSKLSQNDLISTFYKSIKNVIFLFNLIVIILLTNSCTSHEDQQVVLRIDKSVVEKDEFMKRVSFVPHQSQSINPEQVKKDVLASLIAEKILAQEAVSLKLDTLEFMSTHITQLEKEAIFEYWVQENIDKFIEVSKDEVKEAYNRSKQIRTVDFWTTPDSSFAARFIKSMSLPQIEQSIEMKDFSLSVQQKIIKYGEIWGPVEDVVYKLKQGELSSPLKVNDEYFVFRLKNIRQNLSTLSDFEANKSLIQEKVWEYKRESKYGKKVLQILRSTGFKIEREQYDRVISALTQRLRFPDEEASPSNLTSVLEFPEIKLDLQAQLENPFIQFKSGAVWTVRDFLRKLAFGPYLLNYKDRNIFRRDVPRILRKMVLLETVAEIGYKSGYEDASYVKKRTKMWHDYLLAAEFQTRCINREDISQEEIVQYYNNHPEKFSSSSLRKIQEVLVSTRELAVDLIKRVQAGELLGDLARKYSIRETGSEGGFSPLLGLNDWGNVSRKAFQLPLNALYGPLKTEDGKYSILQVIEITHGEIKPLAEVTDEIEHLLSNEKNIEIVNQLIETRLQDLDIEINKSIINSLDVSKTPMLVTKSHFPGRLVVPFPIPIGSSASWFKNMYKE